MFKNEIRDYLKNDKINANNWTQFAHLFYKLNGGRVSGYLKEYGLEHVKTIQNEYGYEVLEIYYDTEARRWIAEPVGVYNYGCVRYAGEIVEEHTAWHRGYISRKMVEQYKGSSPKYGYYYDTPTWDSTRYHLRHYYTYSDLIK